MNVCPSVSFLDVMRDRAMYNETVNPAQILDIVRVRSTGLEEKETDVRRDVDLLNLVS